MANTIIYNTMLLYITGLGVMRGVMAYHSMSDRLSLPSHPHGGTQGKRMVSQTEFILSEIFFCFVLGVRFKNSGLELNFYLIYSLHVMKSLPIF